MEPEFNRRIQVVVQAEQEGYEKRDARAGWIFGIVVGLFVALVSAEAILHGIHASLERRPGPKDLMSGARREVPAFSAKPTFPRLQVSAPADLKEFRAREETELNSYGWLNRTGDVVRIPVERAMELALQRGFPVRADVNHSRLGPTPFELQQQRTNSTQPETALPR